MPLMAIDDFGPDERVDSITQHETPENQRGDQLVVGDLSNSQKNS
jgi:hypothetical protein